MFRSSATVPVGTLLFCHHAGLPIDRVHDQPAGGGHVFAVARDGQRVLHAWRRVEELDRRASR
jgi:hypothetical protein